MRCAPSAGVHEAVLFAFDLIEHDGDDLRDLPLYARAIPAHHQPGAVLLDLVDP